MPVRPVRPSARPVATAAKPRIRPLQGVLKPGPLEAVNGEALEFNDSVEEESAPAEETLAAAERAAVAPGDRPTVGKPLMRSVPKAHSGAPGIAGAAAPEDFSEATLPVPEKWANRAERTVRLREENYRCHVCDENGVQCTAAFPTLQKLSAHRSQAHGMFNTASTFAITNQCPVCLRAFSSHMTAAGHLQKL